MEVGVIAVVLGRVDMDPAGHAEGPQADGYQHRAYTQFSPPRGTRGKRDTRCGKSGSRSEHHCGVTQPPADSKRHGGLELRFGAHEGSHRYHVVHLESVIGSQPESGEVECRELAHPSRTVL